MLRHCWLFLWSFLEASTAHERWFSVTIPSNNDKRQRFRLRDDSHKRSVHIKTERRATRTGNLKIVRYSGIFGEGKLQNRSTAETKGWGRGGGKTKEISMKNISVKVITNRIIWNSNKQKTKKTSNNKHEQPMLKLDKKPDDNNIQTEISSSQPLKSFTTKCAPGWNKKQRRLNHYSKGRGTHLQARAVCESLRVVKVDLRCVLKMLQLPSNQHKMPDPLPLTSSSSSYLPAYLRMSRPKQEATRPASVPSMTSQRRDTVGYTWDDGETLKGQASNFHSSLPFPNHLLRKIPGVVKLWGLISLWTVRLSQGLHNSRPDRKPTLFLPPRERVGVHCSLRHSTRLSFHNNVGDDLALVQWDTLGSHKQTPLLFISTWVFGATCKQH